MPDVVVFTGLPGTGKSTLSERIGRHLSAPVFAGDWLLGALKPASAALATLDRDTMLQVYTGLLRVLVLRQLQLGQSAVVDALLSSEQLMGWQTISEEHGGRMVIVECVCSDITLHQARMEGRVRGIPGWHEVDWAHVEAMRALYPRLSLDCLVVDSVQSLDANERRVRQELA